MQGLYIQANSKQLVGAKIAKFALETKGRAKERGIPVTIINVEEMPLYMQFVGMSYLRNGRVIKNDLRDLQFFTLSRFAPPEMQSYTGRAVVIDPDIFALSDIGPLFEMHLGDAAIAACTKKDAWDSSVMVLECEKLKHWSIKSLLTDLTDKKTDYEEWMTLRNEHVTELSRDWNSLDALSPATKMLHTTVRITQPWRTGLPIDFTIQPMPKLFGFIPREPIHKLLGKYPTHYRPHPNAQIEASVLTLIRDAIDAGALMRSDVETGIASSNIRPDIFEALARLPSA